MIFLSIIVSSYLNWRPTLIVFMSAVVFLILNPIKSKYLATVSILFLFFVPIFSFLSLEDKAMLFAKLFVVIMIITLFTMVVEISHEKKIKKASKIRGI